MKRIDTGIRTLRIVLVVTAIFTVLSVVGFMMGPRDKGTPSLLAEANAAGAWWNDGESQTQALAPTIARLTEHENQLRDIQLDKTERIFAMASGVLREKTIRENPGDKGSTAANDAQQKLAEAFSGLQQRIISHYDHAGAIKTSGAFPLDKEVGKILQTFDISL